MQRLDVTTTNPKHLDTLARVKRFSAGRPVGNVLLELAGELLDAEDRDNERENMIAELAACEARIEELEAENAALKAQVAESEVEALRFKNELAEAVRENQSLTRTAQNLGRLHEQAFNELWDLRKKVDRQRIRNQARRAVSWAVGRLGGGR